MMLVLFFSTESFYILRLLLVYVLHVFCVNYYFFFVFGMKMVVKKCAVSLKNHPTTFSTNYSLKKKIVIKSY